VKDPSFQIAHAIYALERILNEFQKRSANFDIVFFDGDFTSSHLIVFILSMLV